ncbi:MAG: hotdog domain-containing protein [Myxococcota bacterium]
MINTHPKISKRLCGEAVELSEGKATARFTTTEEMVVDDHGLVHGGFVFGLVDHAAMLAVNDPNVVLGSADVRFLAPVKVGAEVLAAAEITETKGKKRVIQVRASVGGAKVFEGTMVAFVLPKHVLDGQ